MNKKIKQIIEKTYNKFYIRYENASVIVDPTHKNWNPLFKGINDIKMHKEMMNLVKKILINIIKNI